MNPLTHMLPLETEGIIMLEQGKCSHGVMKQMQMIHINETLYSMSNIHWDSICTGLVNKMHLAILSTKKVKSPKIWKVWWIKRKTSSGVLFFSMITENVLSLMTICPTYVAKPSPVISHYASPSSLSDAVVSICTSWCRHRQKRNGRKQRRRGGRQENAVGFYL